MIFFVLEETRALHFGWRGRRTLVRGKIVHSVRVWHLVFFFFFCLRYVRPLGSGKNLKWKKKKNSTKPNRKIKQHSSTMIKKNTKTKTFFSSNHGEPERRRVPNYCSRESEDSCVARRTLSSPSESETPLSRCYGRGGGDRRWLMMTAGEWDNTRATGGQTHRLRAEERVTFLFGRRRPTVQDCNAAATGSGEKRFQFFP